jgi:hypothetical protein
MSAELNAALEARRKAMREGYVDTEAIETIDRLLPTSDPRHPFHANFVAGKMFAEGIQQAYLRAFQLATAAPLLGERPRP